MSVLIAFLIALLPSVARADCGDTDRDTDYTLDCDFDGYDIVYCQYDNLDFELCDCDDYEALAHPGLVDRCDDRIDNDCNGFPNEGCDRDIQQATLTGGSSCGIGRGNWLFLLPIALLGGSRLFRRAS